MKNRGGGEPSERPLTLCPPIVILTLYEGFRNAVHGENKQTGRWVGVGSDTYTHTQGWCQVARRQADLLSSGCFFFLIISYLWEAVLRCAAPCMYTLFLHAIGTLEFCWFIQREECDVVVGR